MGNSSARGVVQAAVAMAGVGTLTGINATLGGYPVFGGQAVRYAVAAVILLAVVRLKGPMPRPRAGDLGLLALLAATGMAGFNICIIEATRDASPATVGTVIATVPVVLAVAVPLQQGRRPAARSLLAALLVTAGAGLATGLGHSSAGGLLWSLGALGGEAAFSLLAVPLLPRLGPIAVSGYSAALAVPLLVVAGLIAGGPFVRMPTPHEALALGYLALVITVVLFLVWYDALARLGADRAGLFAGIIPLSAVATTVVLGLGTPGAGDLAGAVLVGAGVVLGLRAPAVSARGGAGADVLVREPVATPASRT